MTLVINQLETQQKEQLKFMLFKYPHKPISSSLGASEDKIADYLLSELVKMKAVDRNILLGAKRNNELCGLACLTYLAWESDIYGFPMAKVSYIMALGAYKEATEIYDGLLANILSISESLKYRHLTCQIPTADYTLVHSIHKAGFLLMDTTLEYIWNASSIKVEDTPKTWVIRPVAESDISPMKILARDTYMYKTKTRYAMDPHLSIDKTGELYAEWFHNACRGTFADVVLVAAENQEPIGYTMFKLERELSKSMGFQMGRFGVNAVSPEKLRRGINRSLLTAIVQWCADNGVKYAMGRVLTHNYGMHRSCQRSGGFVGYSVHSFHKWLGD